MTRRRGRNPPIRCRIKSAGGGGGGGGAQATLVTREQGQFNHVWNDGGSGGHKDVSLWRPQVNQHCALTRTHTNARSTRLPLPLRHRRPYRFLKAGCSSATTPNRTSAHATIIRTRPCSSPKLAMHSCPLTTSSTSGTKLGVTMNGHDIMNGHVFERPN